MHVTNQLLSESKLIFNHIPKVGGSSIHFFFEEIFGKEHVFRYRSRDVTDDTKTMETLTEKERQQYKFFQGHWKYGYHELFKQKCLYFGIVRDPIDRLISIYYYDRKKGRDDRKEYARSVNLYDFVSKLIELNRDNYSGAQTNMLTLKDNLEDAKKVIENDYLICCTTDQLNDCQGVLARLYGRPDVAPLHRNATKAQQTGERYERIRARLRRRYSSVFTLDYAFLDYVQNRFDQSYSKLGVSEAA